MMAHAKLPLLMGILIMMQHNLWQHVRWLLRGVVVLCVMINGVKWYDGLYGYRSLVKLQHHVATLQHDNHALTMHHQRMQWYHAALCAHHPLVLENIARLEHGFIKDGEYFIKD
jgi:cell division protein FtsB